MRHREVERIGVVACRVPGGWRLELHPAQFDGRRVARLERLVAGVHGEIPGRVLGNLVEHFPGSERGHASGRQRQPLLQLLEHGPIRVLHAVVALDYVVVRLAGEDLRVSRIGEPVRVGQGHRAAERPVAGDRAVLRHQLFPEERHQLFPPFLRCGAVETLERRAVLEPRVLGERRAENPGVQAAEHLRCPNAIERDENQRVPRGGGLPAGGKGCQPDQQRNDNDGDPCDHSHLAAESTAMFPRRLRGGNSSNSAR